MSPQFTQLIDRYAAGADDLGQAIAGLSRQQLQAYPVPGTWSIQEIVLHMFDSDLVYADRMKRVIAEDNPTLIAFDPTKAAARLHYRVQSVPLACGLFAGNRQLMTALLRQLDDADFARVGQHNERGPLSLEDLVRGAADHLEHHMKFVNEKKTLVTKL